MRKYERIIADALDKKADTLIIAGHYQSYATRELVRAPSSIRLKKKPLLNRGLFRFDCLVSIQT